MGKVIGLTGAIGSGKSQVAAIWRDCRLHIIDCDVVYRELLESSQALRDAIFEAFPNVNRNGELNRAALGDIVFSDADSLVKLESLTHPVITNEVAQRVAKIQSDVAIEAVALLKSDIVNLCDVIVVVAAPTELRIQRVMARDNLSREQVQLRIDAQPSEQYYQGRADYVIANDGTEEQLRANACEILNNIRRT